ncbi:MAG: DMT family transporter [Synechococcales bacterium]|nr:DMT family transporter [Synechococcales bacterium]
MASVKLGNQPPPRWKIGLILAVGILSISTSAIFVRLALGAVEAPGVGFSLLLAASRLFVAAIALLPAWRGIQQRQLQRGAIAYSMGAGILLAAHFASWISSLSFTSIAASTTLVTTNPIWVALLSWLWFRETLSRLTLMGIGVTLVGGALIGFGDGGGTAASQPLLGNGLALVGSWAVSLYFLVGREAQRRGMTIQLHLAIAYSLAALILLPLPPLLGSSYGGQPPLVYISIVLMAIFPQLIGHSSLNWAVFWISPTLVTLTILMEPIGASLLGFLIFGEIPGLGALVGAGIVLLGVAIAALGSRSPKPTPD